MVKPEIEEFAKRLISQVRDRSIADCDILLRATGNIPRKAMAREIQEWFIIRPRDNDDP